LFAFAVGGGGAAVHSTSSSSPFTAPAGGAVLRGVAGGGLVGFFGFPDYYCYY